MTAVDPIYFHVSKKLRPLKKLLFIMPSRMYVGVAIKKKILTLMNLHLIQIYSIHEMKENSISFILGFYSQYVCGLFY